MPDENDTAKCQLGWMPHAREYAESRGRFPAGERVPPEKVMKWTVQNSRLPEAGIWDFAVEHGGLMGIVVSGYQHGYEAARMGVQILNGAKPSEIAIRVPQQGDKAINKTRFRDLGIYVPLSLLRRTKQFT
jgi:ABC-type uncharacterized transport system substrate-binding protein